MLSTALHPPPHIGFDPSGTLVWLGLALVLAAGAIAVGVFVLVQRARALERALASLSALDEIKSLLTKLQSEREDIDLRRIEHVLLDVRANLGRTEDALLRAVQRPRATGELPAALPPDSLPERLTNRLLALGYERIQIATPPEALAELGSKGEILVEARRDGALWKGRALVEQGAFTQIDLKPVYSMFP